MLHYLKLLKYASRRDIQGDIDAVFGNQNLRAYSFLCRAEWYEDKDGIRYPCVESNRGRTYNNIYVELLAGCNEADNLAFIAPGVSFHLDHRWPLTELHFDVFEEFQVIYNRGRPKFIGYGDESRIVYMMPRGSVFLHAEAYGRLKKAYVRQLPNRLLALNLPEVAEV